MHRLLRSCLFAKLALIISIEAAVPLERFFPYGLGNGDQRLSSGDDTFSPAVRLQIMFPFDRNTETTIFVNTNGALSFQNGIDKYTPECGALDMKTRMIAPYWADAHTGQGLGGDVFYRQTMETVHLRKAAQDITAAYPGLWGINIRWLFIATWIGVPYYGANACYTSINDKAIPRNTFQVTLATDGTYSFVIFYYNKITWTAGTASGGEECTGIGGLPARVGFDAGDGINFYALPSSCTDDIVKIVSTSNMNSPGKWLFRIDSSISTAKCDSRRYTGQSREKLRISPTFVDAFGNVPIVISGPCFNMTSLAECVFHDIVKGPIRTNATVYYVYDPPQAFCMVPFMYGTGRIDVDLVVWDLDRANVSTTFNGFLTIIWGSPNVEVHILRGSPDPSILQFKWNPKLSMMDNATTVDIEMIWFNLLDETWQFLANVGATIENNGSYVTNVTTLPPDFDTLLLSRSALAFKVVPTTQAKERNYNGAIFSHPTCASMIFTVETLAETCDRWYNYHSEGRPKGLIPCPPYLRQAEIDPNFESTGWTEEWLNFFRSGAFAAFRSRTPNSYDAGQECTYAHDGTLLVGQPSGGASNWVSPLRSEWRHWKFDIVPWCNCCRNKSDVASCEKFYQRRPSDTGVTYKPPRIALINGDPHIKTFDRLQYTFNGAGEFWLLKPAEGDGLMMQARMQQGVNLTGATVFTAFVLKDNNVTVQVERAQAYAVDVIVNGYRIELEKQSLRTQTFGSVFVTSEDDNLENILVALQSGISFKIITGKSAMAVMPTVHHRVKRGSFAGLLGDMDGDAANDLTTPDGKLINVSSLPSDIHWKFGVKWIVASNETLFRYSRNTSYESYADPKFRPTVFEIDMAKMPQEALDICGSFRECLYDYAASQNNLEFANQTWKIQTLHEENILDLEVRYKICPPVEIPKNGYIEATRRQYPGSIAHFHCHRGHVRIGNELAICDNSTMTWDASPPLCVPFCLAVLPPKNGNIRFIRAKRQFDPAYIGELETLNIDIFLVDTVVSFSCDPGFWLMGKHTIFCQENSSWSACPPTCVQKLVTSDSRTLESQRSTTPNCLTKSPFSLTSPKRRKMAEKAATKSSAENRRFLKPKRFPLTVVFSITALFVCLLCIVRT